MARFKIYSKDGQSVRYEGKPKYLGVYLNPSCLKFSEISSSEPIAWEVGDYVDYPRTGMRYRLYSIPQPSKEARRGSYGGAFRYSGVELYAATKELEIALFRDLVGNDNNIHFSTSPDVTTFENVHGIARRIQACMDYFYPGRWEIRVADFDADADAEIIEKISTAKDFALSGGTCLDALSKIYELWQDTGWIHSYENGKEVITIGYANKRISENTTDAYLYGKGNGLTAIKKNQTNKDEFATRLYVYGSERNIPSRYYNGKSILNAESVDIRNLMIPLDKWGETDGLPDARKAYLENADAVAKYGVIPKVHYFDSEDAGADIYPSIEGITIGQIRNVLADMEQAEYVPSASIYSDSERADEVLSAVNPEDDGVMNRGGRAYDLSANVSVPFVTRNVDVFPGATRHFIASNYPLMSYTFETTGKGKITLDPDVRGYAANRNYSSVKVKVLLANCKDASAHRVYSEVNIDAEQDESGNWAFDLPAMSVTYDKTDYSLFEANVYLSIEATLAEPGDYDTASFTIMKGSAFWGFNRIASKEFKVSLKQIGFDINERAALGEGKVISMKSGMCEGRNFVISSCKYVSDNDSWLLTCKRQQDDTLGMLFPNSSYEIAEGDTFVLLDIAMPELYVSVAQNRLLAEGQKLLSRASKIQSNYEPSIDAKVMVESGRTLREGMFMEITDEDVVDNTTDYILIDTLSISEDESAIPTYKVTLRERRKVTYKGTPSATSATETKSVEDETEVQPNVDLAGYAKETYVNDKVSEVNNLLASMWSLDDDGNLVTDRNVIIKKNLTIEGDMASDGEGEGTVTGVTSIIIDGVPYFAEDGVIDLSEAFDGLDVDVDLSDYYTKKETSDLVNAAIAGIDLSGYATTAALSKLQGEVDTLESVLGIDEEAQGVIDTWNEVKSFLGEIEVGEDLTSILEGMNADIAKRALDSDLEALGVTVQDNAGNIKKNFDAIASIEENYLPLKGATMEGDIFLPDKKYIRQVANSYAILGYDGKKFVIAAPNRPTTIRSNGTLLHNSSAILDESNYEDYTYSQEYLNVEFAKYLLLESASQTIKGDVTIEGNLVVQGDTTSTSQGTDVGPSGILGINVNGNIYYDGDDGGEDGIIDLSDAFNNITIDTSTLQPLITADNKLPYSLISGTPSLSTVATSGKYSDLSGLPTIPTNNNQLTNGAGYITSTGVTSSLLSSVLGTSGNGGKVLSSTNGGFGWVDLPTTLPASDVYAWAKKSSLALADVPDLSSKYLSTAGGTISGSTAVPLYVDTTASAIGVNLKANNANKAQYGWDSSSGVFMFSYASNAVLGIKDDGTPYYSGNTLLHSGNYSSYALPLSGGTISGSLAINYSAGGDQVLTLRSKPNDASGACRIAFYDGSNTFQGYAMTGWGNLILAHRSLKQIGVGDSGIWCSTDNGTTKNTLIHSGNIGSQTVAAANKLATARTIWGQSFDGSGNVSGNLTLFNATSSNWNRRITAVSSDGASILGALGFYGYGDALNYLYLGTTYTNPWLLINSSGNVTIGASDLAGTDAKLYVNGASSFVGGRMNIPLNGDRVTFNASSGYTMGIVAMNTANTYIEAPLATNSSTGARTPIMIGWRDGTYPFFISTTQNVGIGTTSPADKYKLDVNGDIRSIASSAATRQLVAENPNASLGIGVNASGESFIYTAQSKPIKFYTSGTERMIIAANGAVTMSNELFLGNNMGIYFKNASGTNVLAMYVSPSNVLQVGYNNVDSVAFQKPVTMASTLSVTGSIYTNGALFMNKGGDGIYLTNTGIAFHNSSNAWAADLMYFSRTEITSYKSIIPGANKSYDLGSSSYQWSTIYGVNGIFSGNLVVAGDISA